MAGALVHGAICCSVHGCAVSCTGDSDDDVLIGTCPHDGAVITMASENYMRAHRAGTAKPLDIDAAIAKHQNKAIAHMFEDDGVTLKPEFRDDPADDGDEGFVKELDDDGQGGDDAPRPDVVPTLEEFVKKGYAANSYADRFAGLAPGTPISEVAAARAAARSGQPATDETAEPNAQEV